MKAKFLLLPFVFLIPLGANAQQNDRIQVFGDTPLLATRYSNATAVPGRSIDSTVGKLQARSDSFPTWGRKEISEARPPQSPIKPTPIWAVRGYLPISVATRTATEGSAPIHTSSSES